MLKYLFYSLFFLLSNLSSAQWHFQNPIYNSNSLADVHFIDENNGIIIGQMGTILRTQDGGVLWDYEFNDQLCTIIGDIFFYNENIGWVGGCQYKLFKTIDGGKSWFIQDNIGYQNTQTIESIYFMNEDLGFLVAGREIWKTQNGGDTWTNTHTMDWWIANLRVRSETEMWIVGNDNNVARTLDGGNTWEEITIGPPTNEWLNDIFFFSEDTLCILNLEKMYWSYSNGASWIEKETGVPGSVWHMNFVTKNIAYAFGLYGLIYKTTDRGITWQNQSIADGEDIVLISSYFFDKNNGVAVGGLGYIFQTHDGGENWIERSYGSRIAIEKIKFMNQTHGIAVGNDGRILKTTNSGKNWYEKQTPATKWLQDLCFLDENKIISAGNNGSVVVSYDFGTTWVSRPKNTFHNLLSVWFDTPQHGLLLGEYGGVLETFDQCETLNEIWYNSDERYYDMHFFNHSKGIIIGKDYVNDRGIILHSSDGGKNWVRVMETDYPLKTVFFLDEFNGWAAGDEGGMCITQDGGNSWEYDEPTRLNIRDIAFSSQDTGWMVGDWGIILYSTNGGSSWIMYDDDIVSSSLNSIYLHNDSIGWIAGYSGIILNKGIESTVGIEENPDHVSVEAISNFPNPFSNYTTIPLTLEEGGIVNITIFDLHGRFIKYPQQEYYSEGMHEITIDGSKLNAGIYYYHINYGRVRKQGKFVVVH